VAIPIIAETTMISAEVVGSNPTRSIFSYYRTTALFLSLFSVIVGQKPLLAMPWIKATVKSLMRGCLRFLDFTTSQPVSLLYSVQPVRLYPIRMSILLYCYEELMECTSQVEQMAIKIQYLQKEGRTKRRKKKNGSVYEG
jgi:hypothetical protein